MQTSAPTPGAPMSVQCPRSRTFTYSSPHIITESGHEAEHLIINQLAVVGQRRWSLSSSLGSRARRKHTPQGASEPRLVIRRDVPIRWRYNYPPSIGADPMLWRPRFCTQGNSANKVQCGPYVILMVRNEIRVTKDAKISQSE